MRSNVLEAFDVTARVPWLSPRSVVVGGRGTARLVAEPPTTIDVKWGVRGRRYTWPAGYAGALTLLVMRGDAPLRPVE